MEMIWQEQAISGSFEELLRAWAHGVDESIRNTAEGRNITEWCKKADCWMSVRNIDLSLPTPIPVELEGHTEPARVGARRSRPLTPADYANIAACKKLSGEEWLEIHAWGVRTGMLESWQCGIAHTLAGYAAGEWYREPSHKQAKQGVAILELTKQHGGR